LKPIPILMFHQVLSQKPTQDSSFYVTKDRLDELFCILKRWQFTPVTFEYLEKIKAENLIEKLPKKPIILTFDDGYQNNFTLLLPLLKKYQFNCVLFLLGERHTYNFWDNPIEKDVSMLMNETEIKEFRAFGNEIGAHTMKHVKLTELDVETSKNEIIESKRKLELLLNQKITSFSYPYGMAREIHYEIVANAGFKFAVLTNSGSFNWSKSSFELYRINIPNKITNIQFWYQTSIFFVWNELYLRFRRNLKRKLMEYFGFI
jgi:peptidoglycan/xylan/chitin deacetylase (PgdA/CDA1 family)